MKAIANRNKESENTLMAPIAGKLAEAMLVVMQMFGIKKIESKKLRSSDFERLVSDINIFDGTPDEIKACGFLVKDAIASILAAAGVVGIEITSETKDEEAVLVKNYQALVDHYNSTTPDKEKEPAENKKKPEKDPGFIDVGSLEIPEDDKKA